MKIAHLLLVAIVPAALFGCGGNDNTATQYTPAPATYANLQFVAASFDAPPIDVLIDGKPWVRHLDYGEGTGEQTIAPGVHTVLVQLETPGTPTTVVGPTTLDATAAMDYVVAVAGDVAGPTPITTVTLPHQLAVVPAQSARIQVVNTSAEGPITVYLTAPGATPFSGVPLGTAAYQSSVGPVDVPAGQWVISVAQSYGPNPADVETQYYSNPVTLEGGMDLVVSWLANPVSPPCPPGASCPAAPPILSIVDAFGVTTWVPAAVSSAASLLVVHDSPTAPALGVTVNGNQTTPFVSSVLYGNSTYYEGLTPGINDLAIAPASNLSNVLATRTIALDPNSAYTLYALGPVSELTALITHDDLRRYSTQARLRVIQGSLAANLVDVYVTATGSGITDASPANAALSFGADTGFVSYAQGLYDLTVTTAGTKTPLIGPIGTWLQNGQVATVVLREAPGGGAPYGFIELEDGLLPASFGE